MQGREVSIRAWRFDVVASPATSSPSSCSTTDLEGNDPYDRRLTDHLYGGDTYYRLCQETVLGLGGVALLHALGRQPEVYHMNEGHAALLGIGLLEERLTARRCRGNRTRRRPPSPNVASSPPIPRCPPVTTSSASTRCTPCSAPSAATPSSASDACTTALLNMTYLALRFSRYVNGVAMQHGKVSQQMFPDYHVHAITNGVHAATWLSQPMQALFDNEIPEWRHDNNYFRSVYGIAPAKIANCHEISKQRLFAEVARRSGMQFNPKMLTLGFARRVATYKRASLLFHDPKRLAKLAKKIGGLQILFAGKAHPADIAGKGLIRDVFEAAASLKASGVRILYLENYDWELGALLTQGVDLWVNTPRRPTKPPAPPA